MAALQSMQTEKFASTTTMMESKSTVPVVTHVITDEDIGALQVRYNCCLVCYLNLIIFPVMCQSQNYENVKTLNTKT